MINKQMINYGIKSFVFFQIIFNMSEYKPTNFWLLKKYGNIVHNWENTSMDLIPLKQMFLRFMNMLVYPIGEYRCIHVKTSHKICRSHKLDII